MYLTQLNYLLQTLIFSSSFRIFVFIPPFYFEKTIRQLINLPKDKDKRNPLITPFALAKTLEFSQGLESKFSLKILRVKLLQYHRPVKLLEIVDRSMQRGFPGS